MATVDQAALEVQPGRAQRRRRGDHLGEHRHEHVDLLGQLAELVEVFAERAQHRLRRRLARVALAQRHRQARDPLVGAVEDERLLRGEVVVDGLLRDPDDLGDLRDLHVVEAAHHEQGGRDVGDLLARVPLLALAQSLPRAAPSRPTLLGLARELERPGQLLAQFAHEQALDRVLPGHRQLAEQIVVCEWLLPPRAWAAALRIAVPPARRARAPIPGAGLRSPPLHHAHSLPITSVAQNFQLLYYPRHAQSRGSAQQQIPGARQRSKPRA